MVLKYFEKDGVLWQKRKEGQYQKVVGCKWQFGFMRVAHDELGHKGVFAVKARLQHWQCSFTKPMWI